MAGSTGDSSVRGASVPSGVGIFSVDFLVVVFFPGVAEEVVVTPVVLEESWVRGA
jgi:hypothetical protein